MFCSMGYPGNKCILYYILSVQEAFDLLNALMECTQARGGYTQGTCLFPWSVLGGNILYWQLVTLLFIPPYLPPTINFETLEALSISQVHNLSKVVFVHPLRPLLQLASWPVLMRLQQKWLATFHDRIKRAWAVERQIFYRVLFGDI